MCLFAHTGICCWGVSSCRFKMQKMLQEGGEEQVRGTRGGGGCCMVVPDRDLAQVTAGCAAECCGIQQQRDHMSLLLADWVVCCWGVCLCVVPCAGCCREGCCQDDCCRSRCSSSGRQQGQGQVGQVRIRGASSLGTAPGVSVLGTHRPAWHTQALCTVCPCLCSDACGLAGSDAEFDPKTLYPCCRCAGAASCLMRLTASRTGPATQPRPCLHSPPSTSGL